MIHGAQSCRESRHASTAAQCSTPVFTAAVISFVAYDESQGRLKEAMGAAITRQTSQTPVLRRWWLYLHPARATAKNLSEKQLSPEGR